MPRRPVPEPEVPRARARRSPPRSWRLLLWRARFAVAAAALGCATALVVGELSPTPPPTVPVAVAARALAPGAALTAADVRIVDLPADLAPRGSHRRTGDVAGRSLVVAVPVGLPIVDGLLAGEASGSPPGTVLAPVRLTDPAVAALLRPGNRIDLLAGAAAADGVPTARRLAERALVLPGPPPSRASTGLLGTAETAAGTLTLVAVTPAEAAALAGAVGWASLSAVVVQ